jgi:polyphenol oxidase
MILKEHNGFLFFIFKNLSAFPEIRHAIFTRNNGLSRGVYTGLNLSYSVGDDASFVGTNRKAIANCIGGEEPVFIHQVHQTDIRVIDRNHNGGPAGYDPLTGDGLVTNVSGKTIAIKLADCQAVLMYDPFQKVIANVHSGWRGSIDNIIGRCILVMTEKFGCDPKHIVAGISPSLGPCCSEFINYKTEIPPQYWKYKNDDHHFTFWDISRDQLIDAGVLANNIELSDICTKCNSHLFFSYRQSRDTGRFAAVIGLK